MLCFEWFPKLLLYRELLLIRRKIRLLFFMYLACYKWSIPVKKNLQWNELPKLKSCLANTSGNKYNREDKLNKRKAQEEMRINSQSELHLSWKWAKSPKVMEPSSSHSNELKKLHVLHEHSVLCADPSERIFSGLTWVQLKDPRG